VTAERELVQLLERPGTVVLAFAPNGARSLPLPETVAAHGVTSVEVETPLDALSPDSQGQAVVAFEEARRSGRGSAAARLVDAEETRWLEIFDLESTLGCFLAVLVPTDGDRPNGRVNAVLPPLRATYQLTVGGQIESISPEFTAMLGWTEEQVVGSSSLDVIHPDDHEAGIVAWVELLKQPQAETRIRQRFKLASGGWLWCEVTDQNLLDQPAAHVSGELVDISREMSTHAALERRERLLDRLSQALPTGVFQMDADGVASVCNDRWRELTGLHQDDGLQAMLANLAEPGQVSAALSRAIDHGTDADLEVAFVAGAGSCAFGNLHLRPLREDAEHLGLLVTLDDVTGLRTYQLQLADQARRDPLTGILNRFGIEEILRATVADTTVTETAVADHEPRRSTAVLFIDLDRFKRINDTNGHAVGDEVLRQVATCIEDQLRAEDTVGRIGGDEFLVVAPDTTASRAAALADRIGEALPSLGRRLSADRTVPLSIGASIGVAVAEPDDDFDSLIRRADQAMYHVKRDPERSSTVAP